MPGIAVDKPILAKPRVVLAGGSGQVGTVLARHFYRQGYDVSVLARTTFSAPWRVVAWNGREPGGWVKALDGADAVINLAGRSVDCRYAARNRAKILESRVKTTELIGQAIEQLAQPPSVWLNASTATIYRHALDRAMDEETGELGGRETSVPDTWRFSIEVATRWQRGGKRHSSGHLRWIRERSRCEAR
jgi:NAD dependent epimerase/dehydratase family enzyme